MFSINNEMINYLVLKNLGLLKTIKVVLTKYGGKCFIVWNTYSRTDKTCHKFPINWSNKE